MTAAQTLIWQTAGCPPVDGAKGKLLEDQPGWCDITGEWCERTADAKRALGSNFTDQSLWRRHTGRVGQAALWCTSGKGTQSPRLWSWICAPGETLPESVEKAPLHVPGLCQTNRANTTPVVEILAHPPEGEWVVTVALSGQKHVLPYARTNHGAGRWAIRMEDTTVTATPDEWSHVHTHVLALRRLGQSDASIKAGLPAFIKTGTQLEQVMHHLAEIRPWAAAPITDLALWTITKKILEEK